jgi:hypothetical protein
LCLEEDYRSFQTKISAQEIFRRKNAQNRKIKKSENLNMALFAERKVRMVVSGDPFLLYFASFCDCSMKFGVQSGGCAFNPLRLSVCGSLRLARNSFFNELSIIFINTVSNYYSYRFTGWVGKQGFHHQQHSIDR